MALVRRQTQITIERIAVNVVHMTEAGGNPANNQNQNRPSDSDHHGVPPKRTAIDGCSHAALNGRNQITTRIPLPNHPIG